MKEFKIHPSYSKVPFDNTFDGTANCGNKCALDESHCENCVIYMTQQEIDAAWSSGGIMVELLDK